MGAMAWKCGCPASLANVRTVAFAACFLGVTAIQQAGLTVERDVLMREGANATDGAAMLPVAPVPGDVTRPAMSLFYTLAAIFATMLLGYAFVRSRLVVPDRGDLNLMEQYAANIGLPLLVFKAVATAKLGTVDVGIVCACTLGKLIVAVTVWLLTYVGYRPGGPRTSGQQCVTATVFAFFSVASNDFALGFPVIHALYGERMDMDIYITANAWVGALLFIPAAMVVFTVFAARPSVADDSSAKRKGWFDVACDIAYNPIIFGTMLGLAYQCALFLGVLTDIPAAGINVIKFLTAPYNFCSVLLTGAALQNLKVEMWPVVLALMKGVACAYLSYAFAGQLVGRFAGDASVLPGLAENLKDFAFFYGSIPASSAPLIFARKYDPASTTIVATAILLGLVFGGPIMFTTALFLERARIDMSSIVSAVHFATNGLSLVCGAVVVSLILSLRLEGGFRSPTRALLACFGVVATGYAACMLLVNPHVRPETCAKYNHDDFDIIIVLVNWSQNACRLLLLCLQGVMVFDSEGLPGLGQGLALACLLMPILPALYLFPSVVNEVCQYPYWRSIQQDSSRVHLLLNLSWSIALLAATATLAALALWRGRGAKEDITDEHPTVYNSPQSADTPHAGARDHQGLKDAENHHSWTPSGVVQALIITQALRLIMQVVNCSQVLHWQNVMGSFTEMLVLEDILECGQPVIMLVALVLDGSFGPCTGALGLKRHSTGAASPP